MISGHAYSYQLFVDTIRSKFPELATTTPEGTPYQPFPEVYKIDTSKAVKDLGIEFRPLEETVVDTVNSLIALKAKLA